MLLRTAPSDKFLALIPKVFSSSNPMGDTLKYLCAQTVRNSKPTIDYKARQRKLRPLTRVPSFTLALGRLLKRTKPLSYTQRVLSIRTRRGQRESALSSG